MTLASVPTIGFVPSTDLTRARMFYGGVLGLPVEEMTAFACVLRTGDVMLRVTAVEDLLPQPFTIFGWRVEDIAATVAELSEEGVEFLRYPGMEQDDAGIWTAPDGTRVAWFRDPDGNTLSLTQFG